MSYDSESSNQGNMNNRTASQILIKALDNQKFEKSLFNI